MRNADMETGEIEVHATSLCVVGPAVTPAIPVASAKGGNLPAEELRLRYRYLDLRRAELQKNIILRHRLLQTTRRYLDQRGFLEVETPSLPSRHQKGRVTIWSPVVYTKGSFTPCRNHHSCTSSY